MTDIQELLVHAEETRKLFLNLYSDDDDVIDDEMSVLLILIIL